MKRENIDGRPIYSPYLWQRMLIIENKLIRLGYRESSRNENLFYKKVHNGWVYADLRGSEWIPLWEEFGLNMYFYDDVPYWMFLKELILIKRYDCPILTFKESYDHYFNKIPTGYCRTCNKDILPFLNEYELTKYQLDLTIEFNYCKTCKFKA